MAERTIVGVDFSGADEAREVNTWITEAHLDMEKPELIISECYPIRREDLTTKLADERFAVAGVDFPFSVPYGFAKELNGGAMTMPQLWEVIKEMKFADFETKRNRYVKYKAGGRLHLRAGDIYWPKALSCLQTGGPDMLKMTFYGMQMLHRLWKAACLVPPIHDQERKPRTLLETMPGTALGVWRLHNTLYKNGSGIEDRRRRRDRRKENVAGLKQRERVGLHLHLPERVERKCIETSGGDALDSLVAAIVAARWYIKSTDFRSPGEIMPRDDRRARRRLGRLSFHVEDMNDLRAKELALAKLEGWIYAPRPVEQ